jgi:hypothetical protein
MGVAVRSAPGGVSLLRMRRHAVAATRRRVRPIRPPVSPREYLETLALTPADESFVTGNGIAARCRYVINYDDVTVNEDVDNDWWFCNADFLEYFFASHAPRRDFVLFSHNSDRPIDQGLYRFVRRRRLRAWFAANADLAHPKLHALPLGIANPRWRHGDGAALERVQQAALPKTRLFDASYDVGTARAAREYCRDQTRIPPAPRRDFDEYLRDLASSHFCIAPRGNGIDTHRLWEALYLRTVPVVVRSRVVEENPDLPVVVLDDWAQFGAIEFTPELYEATWGTWDPEVLRLDRWFEERVLPVVAAAAR